MTKYTIETGGPLPPALTRRERARLVDRVVRECRRDAAFAQLLANNLHAAGARLPPIEDGGGRPTTWTHSARVRLFAEFALLRERGLEADAAREQIASEMGRGVSARHLSNVMSKARSDSENRVILEDFGPTLRELVHRWCFTQTPSA